MLEGLKYNGGEKDYVKNKSIQHQSLAKFTNQNLDLSVNQDIGVGLDCAVIRLKYGLNLVQTTDFLYPIVDDPFIMGQIACANVLSDIYTLGVTDVDSLQMILGVPCSMTPKERDIVLSLMCDGFKERAKLAGCSITGGDTKENLWLTIGGVATAVISPTSMIRPVSAEIGDALVLTKPLGTNAATTVHRWLGDEEKLNLLNKCINETEIKTAYYQALHIMTTLNRTAASLMHYFGVHAATDITGFGLVGHAENLLRHQENSLDFIIDTLPLIKYMYEVEIQLNNKFKLLQGKAIETSGGLLICIPFKNVKSFVEKLKESDCESWLIGRVVEGSGQVKILDKDKLNVIGVTSIYSQGIYCPNIELPGKNLIS